MMAEHAENSEPPVYIDFLNRFDIHELQLTNEQILEAIEHSLAMQGRGETVIGERTHLQPNAGVEGHFNVLRGWLGDDIGTAGVKVVGDFYDNYQENRPSEYGLLALFDPCTGAPRAVLDATALTDMRTGAITALGAKYLARKDSKILGHIGARGSAYWNVRLLTHLFEFDEIRIHSRRVESRTRFGERLADELGRPVTVVDSWQACVMGADIVVEAARLTEPEPLLQTAWVAAGGLVIPYGTKSALEVDILDKMDKVVVDDWGQARAGTLGALRAHVDSGRLSESTLYGELGEIVAGKKPGRESADETILFWHRGMSLSDIALGHAMLQRAIALGVGQRLRWY